MPHELDFLDEYIISRFPTGSRVICNPPPMDTDEDWCILYDKVDFRTIDRVLVDRGYYYSGKYYNKTTKFRTYRHNTNPLNLIMTRHLDWYERFQEATDIATQENILDKNERVELFEMILGNRRPTERSKAITNYLVQAYQYLSNGPQPTPYRWFGTSTTTTDTSLF